jgi:5-methylthioribose kinase
MSNCLESVRYVDGKCSVIDQLKLPGELVYIDVKSKEDAWSVIRKMQVRGAPLIGIVAALGLAVDVDCKRKPLRDVTQAALYILEGTQYLRTSRPTAAPLFIMMDMLDAKIRGMSVAAGATGDQLIDAVIKFAKDLWAEDLDNNKRMAAHGADHILKLCKRRKLRVLTICNTGSLATAGYGTALGVIRRLHELGALEHAYACETRPYNQGARLTAFEIVHDNLPGTLIPDSAASALMAVKGIDVVVVGGDRVTVNGDLANKIGTYQLAIAAQYHGVPFFTAIGSTVVDVSMGSGACIHVEERPGHEMTSVGGVAIAPAGISTWNPAFDVTPAALIAGIITECGVATHANSASDDDSRVYDMTKFLIAHNVIPKPTPEPELKEQQAEASAAAAVEGVEVTSNPAIEAVAPAEPVIRYARPVKTHVRYEKLTESTAVRYACADAELRDLLGFDVKGDASDAEVDALAAQCTVVEVGDGNLNFVYIVRGPRASPGASAHTLVIKQALPYVRCVGENWPLTLDRATFEYRALVQEHALCPELVPEVFRFDEARAVIVMRFVAPPCVILRKLHMAGTTGSCGYESHLAKFAAATLFGTSGLVLGGAELRARVAAWSANSAMCALTEQVIFTDPYYAAPYNHWEKVSPELDATITSGIYQDAALKVAVAALKTKFLTSTEAMLHGDLHTGSIMTSPVDGATVVIDPEFAFYGPMGFDVGLLVANLAMAFCSHCCAPACADYAQSLLRDMASFHAQFEAHFLQLWTDSLAAGDGGEWFSGKVFADQPALLAAAQQSFLQGVWRDTLGFAGAEMIRRVVGIAHVADLDSDDAEAAAAGDVRAAAMAGEEGKHARVYCSYLALRLGKAFVMAGANGGVADMPALVELARKEAVATAHLNRAGLGKDYSTLYPWV